MPAADISSGAVRHGTLTREKRRGLFGLECADSIEWRHWVPGTEYVKQLTLKNVSTNTVKFKYRQTASKAFSMDFPETVKLRPGMSCALKVVFRPVKLQPYSDHIEIIINEADSFTVLVEAFTPAVHVQVPPSLDFGFVPCKEEQSRSLTVRNTGDIQVTLSWKLDAPFSISPASASLAPGQALACKVCFTPQEASSYSGHATCLLGNGGSASCLVTGIAKFPYLSLEQASLDFGSVLVGKSEQRTIRFANHSVVPANFSVVNVDDVLLDNVFTINPMKGTLGSEEFSLMTVTYTPRHTGTFTCETYAMSTLSGNKVNLSLRGNAIGPDVTLSTRSLNFGNVSSGSASSRVLYLHNHSDIPVSYDFQIDPLDVFSMSKPRGLIGACSSCHVTITFKSALAANYWRRVACLLQHQSPLGLDLLATSYTDKARPPPFEARHLTAYLDRLAAGRPPVDHDPGAPSVPPSPLPGLAADDSVASKPNTLLLTNGSLGEGGTLGRGGALTLGGGAGGGGGEVLRMSSSSRPVSAGPGVQVLPGPDSWTLLFEGQDPARALQVDTDTLQFSPCSRLSASEYQAVRVTNTTSVKVTAFVNVPLWQDPSGGDPAPVFQVLPEAADIKPGGQAVFRVAFRPPRDAAHFCQTLTLCGHIKSMRNFRLLTDEQVVPPWTVPITACGNTFLHSNPEFSPKLEVSHKAVVFPPCRPGEHSHQTLMLVNYGDTPIAFALHNSAQLAPAFRARPTHGVMPAKTHMLVALRFSPTDTRPHTARAQLVLNGAPLSTLTITLKGCGHTPRLLLHVGGGPPAAAAAGQKVGAAAPPCTLFFRPTCVGATSSRTLTLHNASRVPLAWQWQLPARLSGVVWVSPSEGLLRGNESCSVQWAFAPAKQKVYDAKTLCIVSNPDSSPAPPPGPSTTHTLSLPSHGEASHASAASGPSSSPSHPSAASWPSSEQGGRQSQAQESVALQVVGEGTGAAMTLDPPLLDFGAVKVGHPVKRMVQLVNQSDGLLRYSLLCRPAPACPDPSSAPPSLGGGAEEGEGQQEGDGAPEAGACRVEWRGRSGVAVEEVREEEVWVDEPQGLLAARASKQVAVTLFPRFRKHYSMQLVCRTTTQPSTPASLPPPPPPLPAPTPLTLGQSAMMATPLTAPLPPTSRGKPPALGSGPGATRLPPMALPSPSPSPAASAASAPGHALPGPQPALFPAPVPPPPSHATQQQPLQTGQQPASGPASVAGVTWPGLPTGDHPGVEGGAGEAAAVGAVSALCPVRAQALFPTLQVTDVLMQGTPKQVAWGMLGLAHINAELSAGVTALELELNRMEERGSLTTEAASKALRPFILDLGCAAEGSELVVVKLELSNTLPLPAAWELHSYDDPDLDMENWVERGRPQTQADIDRAFILEQQIFQVKPRSGLLQPGGSAHITLAYKPAVKGSHQLPLFMHIADGKRLHVQLHGSTVQPPVQRLALTTTTRTFTFDPTPIGEEDPPRQLYLLRNGGPGPVEFTVDVAPLQRMVQEDHRFHVLRLCSPTHGSIPEGGSTALVWQFVPLEPKVYRVQVPLVLSDGSQELITLQGRGYHPARPLEPPPLATEGDRDWAAWAGFNAAPGPGLAPLRLALPSLDLMDLGTALPRGVLRQVLVLTNTCPYPLKFEWRLGVMASSQALQGGHLEVTPTSGLLEPGELGVMRFTLTAGLVPCLLEAEVACHVSVDTDSLLGALQQAQEQEAAEAAAAGLGCTDTGSVIEEVVAQHPALPSRPPLQGTARLLGKELAGTSGVGLGRATLREGAGASSRLPVHQYMTSAAVAKMGRLGEQWQQTLHSLRQQQLDASAPPEYPAPQTLCITLRARVLTPRQIRNGLFIPARDVPNVQAQLGAGALWVPPTQRPFWSDPELKQPELLAKALRPRAPSPSPRQSVLREDHGWTSNSPSNAVDTAVEDSQENLAAGSGRPHNESGGARAPSSPWSPTDLTDPATHAAVQSDGLGAVSDTQHASEPLDLSFATGLLPGAGGSSLGGPLPPVLETSEEVASEPSGLPHSPDTSALHSQPTPPAPADEGRAAAKETTLEPLLPQSLEAELSTANTAASRESNAAFQTAWQPVPRVEAPVVPPRPSATPGQAALSAAHALLQQLLREALDPDRQPELAQALANLPRAPLPAFVQVSQEESQQPAAEWDRAVSDTERRSWVGDIAREAVRKDDPEGCRAVGAEGSAADHRATGGYYSRPQGAVELWDEVTGQQSAGGLAGEKSQAPSIEENALAAVLRDAGFQEFAEAVVESALLSIIQEAAAGEFGDS